MERGLPFKMQNTQIVHASRKPARRNGRVLAGFALACGFAVTSAAPAHAFVAVENAPGAELAESARRLGSPDALNPAAGPGAKEKAAKKKADREAKKAERDAKKAAKKEHQAELAAAKRAKSAPTPKGDDANLNGLGSDDPLEGL